jgi:hypothetical protein
MKRTTSFSAAALFNSIANSKHAVYVANISCAPQLCERLISIRSLRTCLAAASPIDYELPHSAADFWPGSGTNVKTAQHRLDHSSAQLTLILLQPHNGFGC